MTADSHEREQRVLADRYRIERELGAGAMATVYLADDLQHNRRVAIKVLKPELAGFIGSDRFLREIAITAQLTHPHILTLIDSGEADGLLYYVLPYVDGDSLRGRIQSEKQLPLDEALQITREVGDALGYAHSRGIVHRDIKPDNILIGSQHALVADFGIARAASVAGVENLTQTGIVLGTPLYMSPEQAAGEREVDGRSDVYSLACVLYEMLTGQPPYAGATAEAILARKSIERPPSVRVVRKTVPESVERAILRGLATVPSDRFATAKEFVDALDHAPADERANVVPARRQPIVMLSASVAVLVTALAIGVALTQRDKSIEEPTFTSRPIKSLAVLPFVNLSRDPDEDYFADGMHDALITRLWQLRDLITLPRTAVLRYRSGNVPPARIARELGVDALMEASVAHANNRVRIIARLIDGTTGRTLWDSVYERSLKDVLALQSEVAAAIVSSVQVSVTADERSRLTASRSVIPAAHFALLRGREFARRNTAEDYRKSIRSLREAIELDSTYNEARAALGWVYNGAVLMGHLPPKILADSARPVIDRALASDSGLAEAHLALATLLFRYERDWKAAGREYERAIALVPRDARAHEEYAWYLTAIGQPDSALAEAHRTSEIDQLTGDRVLGWVYQRIGQPEKSIAHYERSVDLNEDMTWLRALLAASYAMGGRNAAAAAQCDSIPRDIRESPTTGVCAQVYGIVGRVADARRIIRDMEAAREPEADPYFIALAYTAVADTNKVLEWLQKAYVERSPNIWGLKYANAGRFDLVREHPAFREIIRLMEYP